jgi:hypothetical protein
MFEDQSDAAPADSALKKYILKISLRYCFYSATVKQRWKSQKIDFYKFL